MAKFEALTKYIPQVKGMDSFGEWIIKSGQAPYVKYPEVVVRICEGLSKVRSMNPEYDFLNYQEELKKNGLEWTQKSMQEADVSLKDARCVLALIIGAIRAECFAEGALHPFLREGKMLRWLERLEEIDRQADKR